MNSFAFEKETVDLECYGVSLARVQLSSNALQRGLGLDLLPVPRLTAAGTRIRLPRREKKLFGICHI